jgi:cation transporter-like permease
MSLLTLIGVLLIAGLVIWAVGRLPWIDGGVKNIITIVIIVVVALWLISAFFGVTLGSLNTRIGG